MRSKGSQMAPMPRTAALHAFTLIELLTVVAIIAVLAAILFPVFSQAREKARQAACLSNSKQIGTAVQMYLQDYDERLFPYTSTTGGSRTGAIMAGADKNRLRWWNVLMPFVRSSDVFTCPSDQGPTLSADAAGSNTIARSYIACRSAEALTLAQIDDPVETIVVTEKWDRNSDGPVTDSWIEAFNGDFDFDRKDAHTPRRMYKAGNRHQGLANCVFFDGHAKALPPGDIQESKDLTGCNLVHRYPVPGVMDTSVTSTAAPDEPNICSGFTYGP